MTPRLKVQEQKQHGQRTGGPTTTTRTKRRRHLEQQKAHASRADRASRSRVAAQTLAGRTPPALLSPSSKASLATKHVALQQLPKKERPKALKSLCKEFSCSSALKVVPQCAQSPDTNVCDLGFFNSVDSRLPKLRPYDLDAFFALVEEAHAEYPAEKLDSLYDSKMRICKAILSANPPGNNDYKMPHHGDV